MRVRHSVHDARSRRGMFCGSVRAARVAREYHGNEEHGCVNKSWSMPVGAGGVERG